MVSTKFLFFPPASLWVSKEDWDRRVLIDVRTLDAWSLDMATVDVQREEKERRREIQGGVADFGIGVYRRFNFRSVALVLDRLSSSSNA
jgi:hypothetical protein